MEESSGVRRRPVPVNQCSAPASEDDEGLVFEDEHSKPQEYGFVLGDYVFWVLIAYCAVNLLLWILEQLGLISPQFQEWMPVRWWHSDPHVLQKELFESATLEAGTAANFEGLKKWIEAGPGGWVSSKLILNNYLSERGRYERRLEVKEVVDPDEVLVNLPLSNVLTADLCQQDSTDSTIRQVMEAQRGSSEPIEIAPWTWITLHMLRHSGKGSDAASSSSRLFDGLLQSEYIDAALSYIPVFWDDQDLHWLNGTDFLKVSVLDVHAAIETEYHKLAYLVPSIQDSIQIVDFKKWAMVVMSRGETVYLPDKENKSHMVPQLAVMPLIDLVDHHLPLPERALLSEQDVLDYQQTGSCTNFSYSTALAAVVLRANRQLPANSAVTVGYGVRSNADYLLYHGFTMPHQWSDLSLCMQYSMIELPLPESAPLWKSRFLAHPYRFAVPACPSRKSTPHVIVGAARFLVAEEDDVVGFEERLRKDPSLLDSAAVQRDEKFLHHGAREALASACNTTAQPPVCVSPLSIGSEQRAWRLIVNQTVARVAAHVHSISEDDEVLRNDDVSNTLTVNQRHAVIARREEKLTLQRWCAVAKEMSSVLEGAEGVKEIGVMRIPDEEHLENDEPRLRPMYWKRLLEPVPSNSLLPRECTAR